MVGQSVPGNLHKHAAQHGVLTCVCTLACAALRRDCGPTSVPAVLEMPITMPAWRGAISMWFTLNPPRDSPSVAITRVTAVSPATRPRAAGISISATAAEAMPTLLTVLRAVATANLRRSIKASPSQPPALLAANIARYGRALATPADARSTDNTLRSIRQGRGMQVRVVR